MKCNRFFFSPSFIYPLSFSKYNRVVSNASSKTDKEKCLQALALSLVEVSAYSEKSDHMIPNRSFLLNCSIKALALGKDPLAYSHSSFNQSIVRILCTKNLFFCCVHTKKIKNWCKIRKLCYM